MFIRIILSALFLVVAVWPGAYALEIMLSQVYEQGVDVSSWLMSEKLDGVRGYWDGRQLLSKNGTPFYPPSIFVRNFPDFAIEGEIWGGRRTFEKTVGIVKKQEIDNNWLELNFAVFDVPAATGGFEERLKVAEERRHTQSQKLFRHGSRCNRSYCRGGKKQGQDGLIDSGIARHQNKIQNRHWLFRQGKGNSSSYRVARYLQILRVL